ncbi:MAG: hypothetical protein JWL64_298 [Frankiales bacterium]|nr:hypothetical protein [Frankiales bacterium]
MTSGLADVVERLLAEFEDRLPLSAISVTVQGAARDLRGVPLDAQAELVERLARQRLLDAQQPPPG